MLFDAGGHRKYLTRTEWAAFGKAADAAEPDVRTFCWALAYTGARISELMALTPELVDVGDNRLVFECLKRRRKGIFRGVPVPPHLIVMLEGVHGIGAAKADPTKANRRIWPWCRTTAWTRVKEVCALAGIPEAIAMPKSLRHSFGVQGVTEASVPLGTVKKWMGHSRLESTLVYTDAQGNEERALADRMWR